VKVVKVVVCGGFIFPCGCVVAICNIDAADRRGAVDGICDGMSRKDESDFTTTKNLFDDVNLGFKVSF